MTSVRSASLAQPQLSENQPGLDGLAQSHLVGEYRPTPHPAQRASRRLQLVVERGEVQCGNREERVEIRVLDTLTASSTRCDTCSSTSAPTLPAPSPAPPLRLARPYAYGFNASHSPDRAVRPSVTPTLLRVLDEDPLPARFHLPARALGCKPVMDYRIDQPGIQANTGGAILVEGTWYCPALPGVERRLLHRNLQRRANGQHRRAAARRHRSLPVGRLRLDLDGPRPPAWISPDEKATEIAGGPGDSSPGPLRVPLTQQATSQCCDRQHLPRWPISQPARHDPDCRSAGGKSCSHSVSLSQLSNSASFHRRVRTSRQKMSPEVKIHTMSMAAARSRPALRRHF